MAPVRALAATVAFAFCCAAVGCSDKSKPDPTPDPNALPKLVGDLAVMGTASGLIQVAPDGTTRTLADGAVRWCRVDTRLNAVWFTSVAQDGGEKVTLRILPRGKSAADVATGLPATNVVIIDHAPKSGLGRVSEVKYRVVPALNLAGKGGPKLAHAVGCDGDLGQACYDDEEQKILSSDLVATASAIDSAKLVGADAVAALLLAAGDRKLVSDQRPELDPVPVAGVDTSDCEVPDMCGIGVKVAGTPFLLVSVHNARGDLFHEFLQFYDTRSREFLDPRDPDRRANKPFKDANGAASVADGFASLEGALIATDRMVASLERGVLFGAPDGGVACGFWSGGQRIEAGP